MHIHKWQEQTVKVLDREIKKTKYAVKVQSNIRLIEFVCVKCGMWQKKYKQQRSIYGSPKTKIEWRLITDDSGQIYAKINKKV